MIAWNNLTFFVFYFFIQAQQQGKIVNNMNVVGKKINNVARKEKTFTKGYQQYEAGKLLTRVAKGFLARRRAERMREGSNFEIKVRLSD